jgi:hypothetical protein
MAKDPSDKEPIEELAERVEQTLREIEAWLAQNPPPQSSGR